MRSDIRHSRGFTLIELVAVIIIAGVLAVSVGTRIFPSATLQLQSSRDRVIAAFSSAQQLAMVQRDRVRISFSGNQIDILQDQNNDGNFGAGESVTLNGSSYPLTLAKGLNISSASFDFDRMGRTSAGSLTMTLSGASVNVAISTAGKAE